MKTAAHRAGKSLPALYVETPRAFFDAILKENPFVERQEASVRAILETVANNEVSWLGADQVPVL